MAGLGEPLRGRERLSAAVNDAIAYTSDQTSTVATDMYRNYARTGSAGFETDLRWQSRRLSASLGYALYSAAGLNQVDLYQVPGHGDILLGFAAHKVSGRATVRLPRRVDLTATATWLSERYGSLAVDASGAGVIGRSRRASISGSSPPGVTRSCPASSSG